MKVTDKIMIQGLLTEPNFWGEMSRPTKYKYRNLLKEITQNDKLTQHLKASFSESMNDLKRELDTWLVGIDVTKND